MKKSLKFITLILIVIIVVVGFVFLNKHEKKIVIEDSYLMQK